ncbi:MAG: hypothetical protein Q4G49_07725 [Paracoccus sp. (in: a-proteobacteria)]|nr:hypothetical protein [Paracoccus sp. (in: a-proteobacteria)]
MSALVYESRAHWGQALALALAAHALGVAAFVDWSFGGADEVEAPAETRIEVTGLAVETATLPSAGLTAAQSVAPERLTPAGADGAPLPPVPVAQVAPPVVLTPTAPMATGVASPAEPGGIVGAGGIPAPGTITGTAQSQAVQALIAAIRDRLAEPCLIALPAATPDGAVELTVVGAGDQGIAGFMSAVASRAQGVELLERSVLLDSRQCPALAYARGAASYPVGAITIALAQPVVASGQALRGSVSEQAVLVIVDDNGVVQDLSRFSAVQAGVMAFDVPVHRDGAARDTSQIVMALIGPGIAETVAQNAGRQADHFFAALGPAPGPGVQVAVAAFYLR